MGENHTQGETQVISHDAITNKSAVLFHKLSLNRHIIARGGLVSLRENRKQTADPSATLSACYETTLNVRHGFSRAVQEPKR
jgi:hypothetical protein